MTRSISPHSGNESRQILTVSQLNRLARQLIEDSFATVWIEGELSNLARPSSGHWYFSLKDDTAQVRCAMFRNRNFRVRFNPEAGQKILVKARVSLYEGRGEFQLIAEDMEPAGHGALALAYEQLKKKLQQEGLFDQSRKQELPSLPRHIAVITSPTGAAVHDILTVLERRFPAIPVTILPTAVQGDGAAEQIAEAIELANRLRDEGRESFDVLICGRGGGSLEDLWAFNEEIVARAIANSKIPIVSAVGHEVDVTIADFVADHRAATPSAAAELVSPDQREWQDTLASYQQWMTQQTLGKIRELSQRAEQLGKRLRHPGQQLQARAQRLDHAEIQLRRSFESRLERAKHRLLIADGALQAASPAQRIAALKQRLEQVSTRLPITIRQYLEGLNRQLRHSAQLLDTVSPLATLARGYSITTNSSNQVLLSTDQVSEGEVVKIRLKQGELAAEVTSIKGEQDELSDD